MAGPFDQAQAQTDAAKAAALSALASGGSQAMAAHKAAQEQQGALRAEAVRSALVRASAIDADEAGADLAANGSMAGLSEAGAVPGVGAIYDRYAADQGRAGAARSQAMGDMAKANSNYFSQVQAARPIVEGNAQAARASAVAKIVEAQRKEQEAAAKAAKQEERDSQRDIFDLYGGVEGFRDVVKANADVQNDSWAVQRGADGPGSTPKPYAQIATEEAERSGLARPVAGAIGLRLGRERAADEARKAKEAADTAKLPNKPIPIAEAAARAGVKKPATYVERVSPVKKGYKSADGTAPTGNQRPFDDAVSTAETAVKEAWTAAELNEVLAEAYTAKYGHDFPEQRALILASYGHLLGGY